MHFVVQYIHMSSENYLHKTHTKDFAALNHPSLTVLQKRFQDASNNFSYKTPFHFVSFLEDRNIQDNLTSLKKEKDSPQLTIVFVIGIGGANLGAKAILDAFPKYEGTRTFVFLDTLYEGEEDELRALAQKITDKNQCLMILISKSGKTIETLANAKLLTNVLEERLGNIHDRIVVVTGAESPLHVWAKHEHITHITIPESLTERYGLFSPVTMLPLLFSHISLEDFLRGGKDALQVFLQSSKGQVPESFLSACRLDHYIKPQEATILDFFFFSKQLESVGKWYRQLFAESLGKSETSLGQPFTRSVTPTVSVGTTDLHSSLQLYLGQPHNRISWFFEMISERNNSIGTSDALKKLLPKLDQETPEHVLQVIYESIIEEYNKKGIPLLETKFSSISEYDLGFQMMNAMLTTVSLAQLWNINAFDQPHVEGYKTQVRALL